MIAYVQKRSVGRGLVVWPLLFSSGGEVYGDWTTYIDPAVNGRGARDRAHRDTLIEPDKEVYHWK
jgi:hypothetical protein